MANSHSTLSSLFVDIANAIRSKNGSTASIVADNFPSEINNLRTSFDYNNQEATSISDYQFYGCEDLSNVDCYNLTSIGTSAFEGCSNLKTVILYDGVAEVGENAFKGCSNVTIYCMFDSLPDTWHENWNPDSCEVVWYGGAVEIWDVSATEEDNVIAKLYNDPHNEGKYSLVIDGSGNMKDGSLPSYHTNITSVIINDSVTSIGDWAFYGCTSLTSITYTGTITQWQAIEFTNNWNYGTGNYTIHCTDGDIAKDGTITYH